MTSRRKRLDLAQAAVKRAEWAMIAVAWSDADDDTFHIAVEAWEAAKDVVKNLGAAPVSLS